MPLSLTTTVLNEPYGSGRVREARTEFGGVGVGRRADLTLFVTFRQILCTVGYTEPRLHVDISLRPV